MIRLTAVIPVVAIPVQLYTTYVDPTPSYADKVLNEHVIVQVSKSGDTLITTPPNSPAAVTNAIESVLRAINTEEQSGQ